jgi:hypothetical protein
MCELLMNKANNVTDNLKRRTTKEKFRIHHKWNKRIGLYSFLGKNFLKLTLILAGLVLAIFILDGFLIKASARGNQGIRKPP